MRRPWALMAAAPAAAAGLVVATAAVFAGSAGAPADMSLLLCGTFMSGNQNNFAGNSDQDHPDGSTSAGKTYPYTGQDCEHSGSSDGGTYQWSIDHSNIDVGGPRDEQGTEHVTFSLSDTGNVAAGAQGHVTNFDLSPNDSAGDPCAANGRTIYYASGHQFDAGSCSNGSVGNFNTHGGASTGNHFRGNYQSIVYQYGNMMNSPCPTNSTTYCFEGVLVGQKN